AVLAQAGRPAPPTVNDTIERMAGALTFLRVGDGSLALFNGTGWEQRVLVDTVLKHAGKTAAGTSYLRQMGFARLAAGRMTALVDGGGPPPSPFDHDAHAGTLSFEVSVGNERLITNCGVRQGADRAWRQAQRATAAHSTLVFADTNSSETTPIGIGRRAAVSD